MTIHPIGEASLIPDPNVVSVGSGIGVHEAFGKPSLGDSKQLQEQVPSAAGDIFFSPENEDLFIYRRVTLFVDFLLYPVHLCFLFVDLLFYLEEFFLS